ncbi:transcriptional regulator FtrA [Pedomonas mirosovicensis]|uniref:transcriptional regulator FtrA n=1 Tax=Pedomonas mirosovicensis TaxID=2908641 RepID=UPI0021683747|nr:transcriptional regulator FtrA [Pedomonas mirosovicensis]MCH8685128.1 transcriptional regulator FtrA [Pedomonas mirosovicensis]
MKDHLVAALVYDGLYTFEFGCVTEVFGLHRPEVPAPWYDFAVCAVDSGPLRAAGGVRIEASHGLETLARAGTILLPGWPRDREPPETLLETLRHAHGRGARIASICSGVFLLAATGLLDGRRAACHWMHAESLKARFPAVQVEPDVLYIDEGSFITSAGSAAGLDMMLHLVRRDHGARICNMVARRLVLPPHREGGQAQFVRRPVPVRGATRFAAALDGLRAEVTQPLTVEAMAARAAMSPRTFHRRFREAMGMTPQEWVIRERVEVAKDLLEEVALPIAVVAERAGFGAPETLRLHFKRITGQTPAAYRRLFGGHEGTGDASA